MSNRLEWREVSTQGINPNEGLRTYMSGLQNAHAATNTMRENQRVDDQNAIKGQRGLLNDVLKVDAHLQAKDQQVIANDQRDRYIAAMGKGKEGKAPAYDKLAFENYTTKHFEQGGTLEDLEQDGIFRSTFDTTDPIVMKHLLDASNRYGGRLKSEYEADIKLNNDKRDRDIAALPTDLTEDGHKAAVEQIKLKYEDVRIGLDDLFNRGVSTRNMKLNQQLSGTAPSNRSSNGSVEQPALSRAKAVDTLREAAISDTDHRKAELGKQLEAGMSLEDYNTQMGQIESYLESSLKQIDDEDSRSNIKSFTGATVGVDYSISSSGSLVVGGKDVPEKVGNALIQAAELSGQPLDIILPFVATESAFNPNAVSKTGVKGLMQVTGATATSVYNRNRDLFDRAGLAYDPNDRFNPETSALLGALYIGEIREKLGNDAPMESVYMAYNLGPNDKLVNPLHNRNTPIDQLVPVSAGKISVGLNNNRAVYQNKDGSWKTLNQAAEEIRRRAGVSDIVLNDPAATIEQKATAENIELGIKPPSEDTLVNFSGTDFSDKTDSTLSTARDIVDRYNLTSSTEGKSVKPASDLSGDEIKTMLAAAGIENVSSATAGKLYTKINKNPLLKDLNSDQIGMLLSYTPKGNFTQDIDEVGLDRNIEIISRVWDRNKTAVKANMDDAILAKKILSEFQAKVDPLKDAIRHSEQAIEETALKLEDGSLTDAKERAYNLDIDTHRNKRIQSISSLNFHSNFTADRVNPLLNNIAKFNKTMEDTYADEDARLAQIKIDELATQVGVRPISLTDTTPEIAFNLYRALKSGRNSNKQTDDETPTEVEKLERGIASTKLNPVHHGGLRYIKGVHDGEQTGNPTQGFSKFMDDAEKKALKLKDVIARNPFISDQIKSHLRLKENE